MGVCYFSDIDNSHEINFSMLRVLFVTLIYHVGLCVMSIEVLLLVWETEGTAVQLLIFVMFS